MKILYYDCFAGISGDMNLGALIDLGVDKEYLIKELNKLTISQEFKIKVETKQKMGITGTKVDVILENSNHTHEHVHTHTHNHEHRNLSSIYKIINDSDLNGNVKKLSKDMFLIVAKAEAKVHGKSIDEVHFHEVGAVDSIVDIIGAAISIDNLKVDRIMSSTVELGGGFVKCAHGIIPVPAPATTEILTHIPVHMGKVNSETTTPTGAAILKTMVNEFTDEMDFKIIRTGYGLGTKDFEIPNVLRTFLGEVDDKVKDMQTMLEINIDDMNSELFGYIEDKLFENGALDVYKTPIIMKKGRPAIKLSVLADSTSLHKIENVLLVETTTLGLRKYTVEKVMLDREFITLSTKYGDIPIKRGILDGKVIKMKPEYEECKRLANENGVPIRTIYDEIYKLT
ncbi:nickel pincer cofactor biosynthesis protein LarC [Vallitalea sediminicola]